MDDGVGADLSKRTRPEGKTNACSSIAAIPNAAAISLLEEQMRADRATIARLRQEAFAHRLNVGASPSGQPRWLRRLRRLPALLLRTATWLVKGELGQHYRFWRNHRAARDLAAAEEASRPLDRRPKPTEPLPALVLVCDYQVPRPDQDAGSIYMVDLFSRLLARGFQVHFAAEVENEGDRPYRETLCAMGVRVEDPPGIGGAAALLARLDREPALCIITRVFGGARHLEDLIDRCPGARIVFNTIDLHFVRVERQNALSPSEKTADIARQTRERECRVAALSDATIVVSSAEKAILQEILPATRVSVVPLVAGRKDGTIPPFETRRGIGFVGGFLHQPNVDAVEYFLNEIWPHVRKRLPDAEFQIVGADLPQFLKEECGKRGVRYLGHVPDLDGWLGSLRATVAPLRFGAGAKGKVVSSLAAGVPCVITSIAAEGMGLQAETVLIADDPLAFATHVANLYEDQRSWANASHAGLVYADDAKIRADQAFDDLLLGLGLLSRRRRSVELDGVPGYSEPS